MKWRYRLIRWTQDGWNAFDIKQTGEDVIDGNFASGRPHSREALAAVIYQAGDEGWELVSVIARGPEWAEWYFKKPAE